MAVADHPAPPLTRAIVVWGLGTLFLGLGLLTAVMIGILAEQVKERLDVSNDAIGMLSAVFYLAYAIAQFIGGIVLDRTEPRWILGVSALITAVACYLLADASTLGLTVLGRVLLGIGLASSFLGAIYLASIWFPPERFAFVSGISQLATNIALSVMLIALAITGSIPSLEPAMLGMGVGYVVLGVLMILLVRRPPMISNPVGGPGIAAQLATVVRVPQYWLGTVFFAASFGVLLAWNDLWGVLNQRAYGRSLEMATALTSSISIAAGVGGLLLGWLSDRLGRRSRVSQVGMWALTISLLFVLFLPRLPTAGVFVLLFVFGFFLGSNILGFAQVGQHVPDNARATAFGLMTSMGFLAGSGLDYIIGGLADDGEPPLGSDAAVDHYRTALLPLLVVLVIGAICATFMKDRVAATNSGTRDHDGSHEIPAPGSRDLEGDRADR